MIIETEEQIAAMTKEEVIKKWKLIDGYCDDVLKKVQRLEEILAAVGIAYETYKSEYRYNG